MARSGPPSGATRRAWALLSPPPTPLHFDSGAKLSAEGGRGPRRGKANKDGEKTRATNFTAFLHFYVPLSSHLPQAFGQLRVGSQGTRKGFLSAAVLVHRVVACIAGSNTDPGWGFSPLIPTTGWSKGHCPWNAYANFLYFQGTTKTTSGISKSLIGSPVAAAKLRWRFSFT